MKRAGILAFTLLFVAFAVHANGPANKVTGSFIQGNVDPRFTVEFTAHEGVVMKNGKTRPAKGMLTAYHLTNPNRYYAVDVSCVNVFSDTDAVFVGLIVMAGPDWEQWVGDYRLLWVHDGGEPGAFADTFHTGRVEDPVVAMEFCTNPPAIPGDTGMDWVVFEGNIQIHYRDPD